MYRSLVYSKSLSFSFAALALGLFITLAFGQTSSDVRVLSLNQPVERALKIGEAHTYQVNLKAGQFLHAEVNHSVRLNAIVSLYAPDGKLLIDMNAQGGFLWRETVSCIAEVDGAYKIEVKTTGQDAVAGSYEIKIVVLHEPTEQDRKRVAAEREFNKGRTLYVQGGSSLADAAKQFETTLSLWREVGDKYWEGVILINLGWARYDSGLSDKAIDPLIQALSLFQEIKDRVGEGKAANGLGVVYNALNQYEKAIYYHEQALIIRKELKDQLGTWATMNNLASAHQDLSQYEKAQNYYEQAIAVSREMKDRPRESSTLYSLGFCHLYFRQYEKARASYEQALTIQREEKDRSGEGSTLSPLGLLYFRLGQFDKAADYFEQALAIRKELKDRSGEGQVLANLGLVYSSSSRLEKASEFYERALAIARETKSRSSEAFVLSNLGSVYSRLGEYEKARDYGEQALALQRELKNPTGELTTLNQVAVIYLQSGQYEKAQGYYERALAIAREVKARVFEGSVLDSLGLVHSYSGQYEKARDYYEQALAITAKEVKDPVGEANTLNALGMTYSNLGQHEKARDFYEQELAIRRELKDRRGEGGALDSLGSVYVKLRLYEKALSFHEQALGIRRELNDRAGEGSTLLSLGGFYSELSQHEKARGFYEQALAITRELKTLMVESHILIGLGNVHLNLGQIEKAGDYYEQALELSKEVKNQISENYALINLGLVYLSLNEYDKARDYYERALAKSKELKDRSNEGIALIVSGVTYSDLSQPGKAQAYYEQALAMSKELKDRRREGITLGAVGYVYFNLRQYEKARGYYEQALAIAREVGNRIGESSALNNLGEVSLSLGQHEKARDYHERGLAIAREIRNKGNEYTALNGLGDVYLKLNRPEKARGFYEQALAIAREVKNRKSQGKTLWNLMTLSGKRNNPRLAIFYGKQAVNAFQEIRGNIKSFDKESQQSFLSDKESAYRALADILISESRLAEAQAVLDLLKEEEFRKLTGRSGEPIFALPYSKAEEEVLRIIENLASLGRALGELRGKRNHTKAEKARFNELFHTELKKAEAALEQAIETLAASAPDVEGRLAAKMREQDVQNILPELGKGTVALYTVIGKAGEAKKAVGPESEKATIGWVLLVTHEFRKAYPIDTKDLEKTVFKFREALRSPQYDPHPLAQSLYRKLFLQTSEKQKTTLAADLETYIGDQKDKTLMWSLDGILRYVPMAALHDGERYLVEKYRNVIFNTQSIARLTDLPKADWEVLGLGVSEAKTVTVDGRTLVFPALTGVESEIHLLVNEKDSAKGIKGILPGVIKMNQDFTKEALFEIALTPRSVIHIASHFWFNPANAEMSFLLLGDGTTLNMTEFENYRTLFRSVDLLSLAACDTATGGVAKSDNTPGQTNGEEVEGFAYKAQYLGAKSVLASLWQVSDEGTKELMVRFYRARQADLQLPKGEALRQSQLALLKGGYKSGEASWQRGPKVEPAGGDKQLPPFTYDSNAPYAHPYYWAPFVLIGNWR